MWFPAPPGRALSEVSCSLLTETVTCLGEPPHLRSLNKVQAATRVSPVSRSIPVTAWVTQAPVLCPLSLVTALVEVWVFSCPSAADPGSSCAVLVFELPTVSSHQLFALKAFFFLIIPKLAAAFPCLKKSCGMETSPHLIPSKPVAGFPAELACSRAPLNDLSAPPVTCPSPCLSWAQKCSLILLNQVVSALLCAAPGFGVRTSPLPSHGSCLLLQPMGDPSFPLAGGSWAAPGARLVLGRFLNWSLTMAAWAHGRREGFMSSGCSEDDNNINYSKHSPSVQLILPVATVPFSIHWKSDVTSSGYE